MDLAIHRIFYLESSSSSSSSSHPSSSAAVSSRIPGIDHSSSPSSTAVEDGTPVVEPILVKQSILSIHHTNGENGISDQNTDQPKLEVTAGLTLYRLHRLLGLTYDNHRLWTLEQSMEGEIFLSVNSYDLGKLVRGSLKELMGWKAGNTASEEILEVKWIPKISVTDASPSKFSNGSTVGFGRNYSITSSFSLLTITSKARQSTIDKVTTRLVKISCLYGVLSVIAHSTLPQALSRSRVEDGDRLFLFDNCRGPSASSQSVHFLLHLPTPASQASPFHVERLKILRWKVIEKKKERRSLNSEDVLPEGSPGDAVASLQVPLPLSLSLADLQRALPLESTCLRCIQSEDASMGLNRRRISQLPVLLLGADSKLLSLQLDISSSTSSDLFMSHQLLDALFENYLGGNAVAPAQETQNMSEQAFLPPPPTRGGGVKSLADVMPGYHDDLEEEEPTMTSFEQLLHNCLQHAGLLPKPSSSPLATSNINYDDYLIAVEMDGIDEENDELSIKVNEEELKQFMESLKEEEYPDDDFYETSLFSYVSSSISTPEDADNHLSCNGGNETSWESKSPWDNLDVITLQPSGPSVDWQTVLAKLIDPWLLAEVVYQLKQDEHEAKEDGFGGALLRLLFLHLSFASDRSQTLYEIFTALEEVICLMILGEEGGGREAYYQALSRRRSTTSPPAASTFSATSSSKREEPPSSHLVIPQNTTEISQKWEWFFTVLRQSFRGAAISPYPHPEQHSLLASIPHNYQNQSEITPSNSIPPLPFIVQQMDRSQIYHSFLKASHEAILAQSVASLRQPLSSSSTVEDIVKCCLISGDIITAARWLAHRKLWSNLTALSIRVAASANFLHLYPVLAYAGDPNYHQFAYFDYALSDYALYGRGHKLREDDLSHVPPLPSADGLIVIEEEGDSLAATTEESNGKGKQRSLNDKRMGEACDLFTITFQLLKELSYHITAREREIEEAAIDLVRYRPLVITVEEVHRQLVGASSGFFDVLQTLLDGSI
eukprot:scaffold1205_cov168-Ochromonas_danica.AAC.8